MCHSTVVCHKSKRSMPYDPTQSGKLHLSQVLQWCRNLLLWGLSPLLLLLSPPSHTPQVSPVLASPILTLLGVCRQTNTEMEQHCSLSHPSTPSMLLELAGVVISMWDPARPTSAEKAPLPLKYGGGARGGQTMERVGHSTVSSCHHYP